MVDLPDEQRLARRQMLEMPELFTSNIWTDTAPAQRWEIESRSDPEWERIRAETRTLALYKGFTVLGGTRFCAEQPTTKAVG